MIRLYNTVTRTKEKFKPLHPRRVSLYSCGPTVYDRQHIGNLRKGVFDDVLKRVLSLHGYIPYSVTNITDVGHLTQDDQDQGEDKLEKGSRRENLTVWQIAKKYEDLWREDLGKINVLPSDHYPHATEYIREQINLIKRLEKKGFTYRTHDGIYFDTSHITDYGDFAHLDIENLQAGSRVELGEKKHITDFALWKFSPQDEQRQMEWDSPWGVGFPGWHSECVVMADSILHAPFDIHTGGKDHIPIHHTNEIAQFKADTGKMMAQYWLHCYFLTIDKGKMSKSDGTFITLDDIIEKGYHPLDFRLLLLMAHYRSDLDFSWDSLEQAKRSRERIITFIERVKQLPHKRNLSLQKSLTTTWKNYKSALFDDLDSPKALALIFDLIRQINTAIDNQEAIPKRHILKLFMRMERVLALDLPLHAEKNVEKIPAEIQDLAQKRWESKQNRDFTTADQIREQLLEMGYEIVDGKGGFTLK